MCEKSKLRKVEVSLQVKFCEKEKFCEWLKFCEKRVFTAQTRVKRSRQKHLKPKRQMPFCQTKSAPKSLNAQRLNAVAKIQRSHAAEHLPANTGKAATNATTPKTTFLLFFWHDKDIHITPFGVDLAFCLAKIRNQS